jgi:hypothetical protein
MNKKVFSLILCGFFIAQLFGGFFLPVVRAEDTSGAPAAVDFSADPDAQKIQGYMQDGINLLTGLAGLAITASVIISGIQYSTSGGNSQAASAAKKRIGNAFLALLALVFLYTFLQWIVPGGIFG